MIDPHVRTVSVGLPQVQEWAGRRRRTAIVKDPVVGPVRATTEGLSGDKAAYRNHGGPDMAVYAYAAEDLDRWGRLLGRPVADGWFGENLTTVGIDVNAALVGERWRVGGALLEVSSVRIPCLTFQLRMQDGGFDATGWVRRFTAEQRPGPYLRVIEEGDLAAGDRIDVVHRPDHEVSVAVMFSALTTEPHLLPALRAVERLPDRVRNKVEGPVRAV